MLSSLFPSRKTPQEQLREWQHTLRSEQRKLDRQIRGTIYLILLLYLLLLLMTRHRHAFNL